MIEDVKEANKFSFQIGVEEKIRDACVGKNEIVNALKKTKGKNLIFWFGCYTNRNNTKTVVGSLNR